MALPATASARSDCAYAGGGPVAVYTSGGVTGDALLGACVDLNQGTVDGGYAEIGSGASGAYGVVDGSDVQPGQAAGYGAITTGYESGGKEPCDLSDDHQTNAEGGTNSGGCFVIRDVIAIPGVPLACGNTTGADFTESRRDGCTAP